MSIANNNRRQTPNDAIQTALGAIRSAPQYLTSTIGTTAQTLSQLGLTDSTAGQGTRRIRILNKHASQYVGISLQLASAATEAVTIGGSTQVAPGQTLEMLVGANMRAYLIGSASGTDFNLTIHDLD